MATVTRNAVLVADGFDLSSHFRSIEISQNADAPEATTFASAGSREFAKGLVERSVSGEGFFAYNSTNDALSVDKHFADKFSSSANRLITLARNGFSAPGDDAVMLNTKQASYNIQETVGEMLMTTFEAKSSLDGATHHWAANGYMLLYQSVSGVLNAASVDDGAGATTGWLAHCHVTGGTFTSVTVKIQHSTDNVTWADLITFSAFSAVGAQQSVNTSTPVNRYVRAIISAFTGTSANVVVAIKTGYTGS